MSNYIGQKGYTIYKSTLNSKELEFVKKELAIKPFIVGAPVQSTESFPVYRECGEKIYVPRYYGVNKFGEPSKHKFSESICATNIPFEGSLRECQLDATNAYFSKIDMNIGGCCLIEKGCGKGKTVDGLYIASKLRVKTLVIVHKEFLLDQWVDRIKQYLPTARIGRLQGTTIDVKDKDIVIGMLQSISMKNYPIEIFKEFGLTIVDEVHHISSEVFSRALFKISTKFMLGLSATMNRKDGTTKVIKMFLGDVVYSNLSQGEHDVVVKGIKYMCNDSQFKEVVLDFRGNVQYSTMINKLCDSTHRTEFVVKVILDIHSEYGHGQQMIVLSHTKKVLTYMRDALIHRGLDSVGFYVGGMKRADLDASSEKQVILATYAMAAEALDIPSLTTLIMLTPKTDIQQPVGRILREKHENPLIIDIIDVHDVFQRQWQKRVAFYASQNYRVDEARNTEYIGMKNTTWRIKKASSYTQDTSTADLIGKGCLLTL